MFFISPFVSKLTILVFGLLYPAYASYKAINTRDVPNYVRLMMYWIIFALYTCAETITDVFLSWLPFYYEFKICFVLWLLSPSAHSGSSFLYRNFVHPILRRKEEDIDQYIETAKQQNYLKLLGVSARLFMTVVQNMIKSINWSIFLSKETFAEIWNTDEPEAEAEPETIVQEISAEELDEEYNDVWASFNAPPAKCTRSRQNRSKFAYYKAFYD